jgi:hypothetical protein
MLRASGWVASPSSNVRETTVRGSGPGPAASTVHVREAGDPSALPAPSIARTEKVCDPFPSPEYDLGEVHAAQAPPSRLHSNEPDSVEPNVNEAPADVTVPLGPSVIVVSGAVPSTVHVHSAGDGSATPAVLRARARNVCGPSPRPE